MAHMADIPGEGKRTKQQRAEWSRECLTQRAPDGRRTHRSRHLDIICAASAGDAGLGQAETRFFAEAEEL